MELKTVFSIYMGAHIIRLSFELSSGFSFLNGAMFILRKDLPVLIFLALFYLSDLQQILKLKAIRELAEWTLKLFWLCSILLIGYLIFTMPIFDREILKWSYEAILTYLAAFPGFYLLFRRAECSRLHSFLLSFLFLDVSGFIYEVPIYPLLDPAVGLYFHESHPFGIPFQILLLPLLAFYVRRNFEAKIRAWLIVPGIVYILFSIWYSQNLHTYIWCIHRIPALFLLMALIYCLKKRSSKSPLISKINDDKKILVPIWEDAGAHLWVLESNFFPGKRRRTST